MAQIKTRTISLEMALRQDEVDVVAMVLSSVGGIGPVRDLAQGVLDALRPVVSDRALRKDGEGYELWETNKYMTGTVRVSGGSF